MNEANGREGLRVAEAWALGLMLGLVILVLLGVAYTIGFNRGESERGALEARSEPLAQEEKAETAPAPAGPGRDLFASSCGSCHVLDAADTTGDVGPDLDDLAPDEQRVLAAIENGGTGAGAMPANLLEGTEAQQVAEYVAAVAGR